VSGRGDVAELGALDRIITAALDEDLASGDLTARLTVPAIALARGQIIAKQALVFCGGPVVVRTFEQLDPGVAVELLVDEGARVEPGTEVVRLAGLARSIATRSAAAAATTTATISARAC